MAVKRFSDKTGQEIPPDELEELRFSIGVTFDYLDGEKTLIENLEKTWHFQKTEATEYRARIQAYLQDLKTRTAAFLTEMSTP